MVTEPIPDVGQAVLDRITALPRTWLIGETPVAELSSAAGTGVGLGLNQRRVDSVPATPTLLVAEPVALTRSSEAVSACS
ncbi:MAG: hypothetical protein ACRDRW_18440 [Pseudonocardiaceae bacterium]